MLHPDGILMRCKGFQPPWASKQGGAFTFTKE